MTSHKRKRLGGSYRTSTQKRTRKQAPSRALVFLDLPREIRDEIYKFTLVFEEDISVLDPSGPRRVPRLYSTGNRSADMHLLCTNRQIHAETALIFYGFNTFNFDGRWGWRNLRYFDRPWISLDAIRVVSLCDLDIIRSGSQSGYISRLGEDCIDGLKKLESLPGLREVTLHMSDTIVTRDIELLRRIQYSIGHRCKIIVAFMRYTLGLTHRSVADMPRFFTPKLSYEASETMKGWEWKISGEVDILESSEDESLAISERLRQQAVIAEIGRRQRACGYRQ